MFKVNIEYIEKELTRSEVEALANQRYGGQGSVQVRFSPLDDSENAAIDFTLDSLITDKQSSLLFSDQYAYTAKMTGLLEDVYSRIKARADLLIKHNEERL